MELLPDHHPPLGILVLTLMLNLILTVILERECFQNYPPLVHHQTPPPPLLPPRPHHHHPPLIEMSLCFHIPSLANTAGRYWVDRVV